MLAAGPLSGQHSDGPGRMATLTLQPNTVWEGRSRAFIPPFQILCLRIWLHVGKAELGSKEVPLKFEPVLSYIWASEPFLEKTTHHLLWAKRPEQTSVHGSQD